MRDNIEFIHQQQEQENFMKKILPMFLRFLLEMRSGENEYTCRQIILEMIYRLPSNDAMKESGNNLLNCLIKIMKDDYEDNAIMAIKILNEQYKQFRNYLGDEPKISFIKFAETMFKRFHEIAAAAFERSQSAPPKKQSEPFTEQEEDKKSLVRSQYSFKVLIECSTVITIMYQLFQQNFPINTFIDLAMQVLSNQVNVKFNQGWVFKDYVTCKTKILSFLAYFIRTESMRDQIMRHGKELAKAVMDMFDTFPHDMFQVRKDMFMALRHIVQTNVRESFLIHTDTILNEKKMLGSCEADLIKSYWFSSIMDFIQFSKQQFNLKQIESAVNIILNNLQDVSLQPILQQNSLKMIIYIVENLKYHNDMDQNYIHQILVQILTCITKNFVIVKNQIREKLQIIQKNADKQSVQQAHENLKDFKILLKNMLNSLKVVVWNLCSSQNHLKFLNENYVKQFLKLFKNGLHCFKLFVGEYYKPGSTKDDQSDYLNRFADLFTPLPQTSFYDVISSAKEFLIANALENQQMRYLFDIFLSDLHTYIPVMEVFIPFLINHIEYIYHPNITPQFLDQLRSIGEIDVIPPLEQKDLIFYQQNLSELLFKVFSKCLQIPTKYSRQHNFDPRELLNEQKEILSPYFTTLLTNQIQCFRKFPNETKYLQILCWLLKAKPTAELISEDQELLNGLLETQNRLQQELPQYKLQLAQVVISIPYRARVLLLHLKTLVQNITYVLEEGQDELLNASCKNLEYWLEALLPDFF